MIGLIPAFESPTKNASVTCGCALATFLYYNLMGMQVHGFKYILHFMGPKWWLAPLMFPIEIISHMARPLSLTVRLYANMFAGEQVTLVFLQYDLVSNPRGLHGAASFRRGGAGIHIHASGHGLCGRCRGARALIG